MSQQDNRAVRRLYTNARVSFESAGEMIFTALVASALRLCGQGFFRPGELAPEDTRRALARRSTDKQAYADGRREIWQRR